MWFLAHDPHELFCDFLPAPEVCKTFLKSGDNFSLAQVTIDASRAVIGYENDVSPYRQEIRDRAGGLLGTDNPQRRPRC